MTRRNPKHTLEQIYVWAACIFGVIVMIWLGVA
jgi:hypothetical protein